MERGYQFTGGVKGPGGVDASVTPSQPFFDKAGSLTLGVHHTLNEATVAAEDLRRRLFGDWPAPAPNAGGPGPLIPGGVSATDRVAQDLAQLLETAVRLSDTINFINARL